MKITKTQIRQIIKEELDATMEEGMFGEMGAKISAGILVYLDTVAPRRDIDIRELANDNAAMDAFLKNLTSGNGKAFGNQLAKDWTNKRVSRDKIMSKYFSTREA